jgi:subtilisin family serine protease
VAAVLDLPGLAAMEPVKPFSVDISVPEGSPFAGRRLQQTSGVWPVPPVALPPWHLARIGAPLGPPSPDTPGVFYGTGIVVYVLDVGIAPHPDFGGRASFGANFAMDGRESDTTCMGHGTHVRARAVGINADLFSLSLSFFRFFVPFVPCPVCCLPVRMCVGWVTADGSYWQGVSTTRPPPPSPPCARDCVQLPMGQLRSTK